MRASGSKRGTVIYIDQWSDVLEEAPTDGDIVFVTHDGFDHYDPEALEGAIADPDGAITVYVAVDTSDLDRKVVDLPCVGDVDIGEIHVHSIAAYHDLDGDHVDESGQPFHAEGEVIGLVLTAEGTEICYPSDTDFLSHHGVVSTHLLIPPIGAHSTMDRHEAAELARTVDSALVLPVRYDTFDAIETDVEAFADELESDGIHVEIF